MPSWPEAAAGRATHLAAAHWNVARLPNKAVARELSTDAGRSHVSHPDGGAWPDPRPRLDGVGAEADAGSGLAASLHDEPGPFDRCRILGSGRDAEAVVASALIEAGQWVLANEAYVSGRWWIERFGGSVVEFGTEDLVGPSGVEAHGDLGDLAYVLITLPRAELGPAAGRPVSVERLVQVRQWIDRYCPDVPLVIDASRLWENAVATESNPGDFTAIADIVLLSAGKDLGASRGGLVAGHRDRWWPRLVAAADVWDAPLGGLDDLEVEQISHGLQAVSAGAAQDRYHEMAQLVRELSGLGLPGVSAGCGSVYLDANAWLPGVPSAELRAQTLLNLIYLATGWRGLGTSTDEVGRSPIIRLAVRDAAPALRGELPLVHGLCAEMQSGMRSLPRDRAAPYLQPAEPLDITAWPVASQPAAPAVPGWLVARPGRGYGPQRALAEALTRFAPAAVLGSSDKVLRDLHQRFTRVDSSSAPAAEHVVVHAVGMHDHSQQSPIDDGDSDLGLVLVDIGSASRWPAVADIEGVDVFWASGAEGGIVAVRMTSPLADALDQASLFTMSSWLSPISLAEAGRLSAG